MRNFLTARAARGLGAFLFLQAVLLLQISDLRGLALQGYDELFQLALGLKVAHGAWPGLDFFTNYGPGVAVISALSWGTAYPFLIEVLVGTALLAAGLLAFWRAGWIAGRPMHNAGLLLALVALAPIWAKYYYVLWPGLFLLVLGDPAAEGASRGRFALLGLVLGLGGWFRLEIGLALSAALAGALVVRWRAKPAGASLGALAGCAAAGAVAPWFAYYGLAWMARGRLEGPGDLLDFYVVSTLAKAVDFHWVAARPRLVGFLEASSLAGWLAVLLALAALAVAAWCFPRAAGGPGRSPLGRRAWCAAWLLLCLSPQALHRFDAMHILQVAAAGAVAAGLGLAVLRETGGSVGRPWRLLVTSVALVLLLALAGRTAAKAVRAAGGWPARIQELATGFGALDPAAPDVQLAAVVRARTRAGDTLLVPSVDTRMLVLAGRPFGGLFPHWSFRLPERWQERQLAALRREPAALVLQADFYRAAEAPPELRPLDFLGRNPRLDAHVAAAYPRVLHATPRWRILAPAAEP
jgi:hypothetical protein